MREDVDIPPEQELDSDSLLLTIQEYEGLELLSDLHSLANVYHLIQTFRRIEMRKYSKSAVEEAIDYCFKGRVRAEMLEKLKEEFVKTQE